MRLKPNIILGMIVAAERGNKGEALELLAMCLKYQLFDPEIDGYVPELRKASPEEIEADRAALRRFRDRYCKKP